MIRVLVAEDSLTARELLVEILSGDSQIQVVGQAKNGAEVIEIATRLRPDVITMDIHMPLVDGLTATREIMALAPTRIVIVSGSASGRDVDLSFNAMRAGALAVVPKPDNPRAPTFDGYRTQLLGTVKAMADVKVVRRWSDRAPRPVAAAPHPRPAGARRARVVAIAASTGGPAALQRILMDLPVDFPCPILVVQHIAQGFVTGLAEWLDASANVGVKVAEHAERLEPRQAYLAPDDRHLGVLDDARAEVAALPPMGGFRPSGTHLFESVARVYGAEAAAVILTGMGSDGVAGLRAVKAAGGQVLAQDEETSVVFGMPREAIAAGVADRVVSVEGIAQELVALVAGGDR